MKQVKVGRAVTIRGVEYVVTDIRSCSHLGGKFFGKWRFELIDADGNKWAKVGKTLTGNTVLSAV
jgi:hypothetical protein